MASRNVSQLRTRKAHADVLAFLEKATKEELGNFYKKFSSDNRDTLAEFIDKEKEELHAAGRPPRDLASPKQFFRILESLGDERESTDPRMSRERLIAAFKDLSFPKGSLFAAGLWDQLPSEYKGQSGGGRTRSRRKGAKPVNGFAVVHSDEKPWVKEPNYRRWLAKLRRHTAKVKKHGEEKHPDNLCVDSKICKGDLGIPRRLMPQFTSARDIKSFTNFIEKYYGIKAVKGTRRAGQLRPSQEEINRVKVEGVKEEIKARKLNPNVPLIVSADGFVIDGHHRWAAYKSQEPSKKMPVLIVKDSARDVLSMAATWGAKHHQF